MHIHYAEEIDPSSVYSEVHCRNYRVVFWVKPSDQYETGASRGYPIFIWEQLFNIPLINVVISEHKFLSLEVMRLGGNPGPSRGYIVVGRAKVALPKVLGIKECQRVGLVRFVDGQTVGEGHIIISLTLIQLIGYLGIEAPFNNLNGEGGEGVEENNISRGRDDPPVDVGGLKFSA
ncbi:hypothetical protein Goshw_011433 [Gossypium schwendimanii]|uniref:C2 domain-containing protein n=1 Tax=Gossypium schwendimanii TaxID=34291 RepID=A0A7J9L2C0_GOSSC|nr:hypothetical protein [Gossypium schwendimanii]